MWAIRYSVGNVSVSVDGAEAEESTGWVFMGEPSYSRVAPAINNRVPAVPIADNAHVTTAATGEDSHAANAAHASPLTAEQPSTSGIEGSVDGAEEVLSEVASTAEGSGASGGWGGGESKE